MKIPKKYVKSDYRHGDLRRAIIEVAKIFIREKKHFEFSIQDLAELTGVSRVAVYRYFKTTDDVLEAIAIDGFQQLAVQLSKCGDQVQQLDRSYIEFGLNDPAAYRVMFLSSICKTKGTELAATSDAAFQELINAFGNSKPARIRALSAWSLVHGFVLLTIDGMIKQTELPLDQESLIQQVLNSVVF